MLKYTLIGWLFLVATAVNAQQLTIAAASDLRFALDEIRGHFQALNPQAQVDIVYGSSGNMSTQIANGAPYDLFFSADIAYPRQLHAQGHAATPPRPYARGRLVVWHNKSGTAPYTLDDLTSENLRRIAIAQPRHAPYGDRARQALKAKGLWQAVEPRLVFGENIAQTASMVESGAADAGLVALSLARFPAMAAQGYTLVEESLHDPLVQGFIITRHSADNALARDFSELMGTHAVTDILRRFGFEAPAADDGAGSDSN